MGRSLSVGLLAQYVGPMPLTTNPAGSPPDPRADDTLEALLPPRRRRAGATVAVLAVFVLLVAWFSPQLLRPSIWSGNGGGALTTFTTPGPQVLTTTLTDTESWTPFTLVEIEDVPGARVIDAWLVTGADARAAERGVAGTPATVEDYLARVLRAPGDAQLPQRLTSDGPAALLVLWAIESCAALEQGAEPVAVLHNVVGATTTDTLPSFTAPDRDLLAGSATTEVDVASDVCTRS
ncbi:hypothetical protein GCM10009616_28960 [Microlunatus lacustris]